MSAFDSPLRQLTQDPAEKGSTGLRPVIFTVAELNFSVGELMKLKQTGLCSAGFLKVCYTWRKPGQAGGASGFSRNFRISRNSHTRATAQ